jgi:CelD/BcsL family acetyltransferase involved in cellulose biosynthesis
MAWRFTRSLRTIIVNDGRDFAVLEEEWEDLYRSSTCATPFQSWEWLYSWWESYGADYELRLILVRDGHLLVGLIPLMLKRWWGSRGWLFFIGTGLTDYLDILVREGWEAQVAKAGRKHSSG